MSLCACVSMPEYVLVHACVRVFVCAYIYNSLSLSLSLLMQFVAPHSLMLFHCSSTYAKCTRTQLIYTHLLNFSMRIHTPTRAFALEHMHLACRGCYSLDVDLDCLVYQLVATPPYIHMHLSILAQHDVHQQFSAPVCACMQRVYALAHANTCTQDGWS